MTFLTQLEQQNAPLFYFGLLNGVAALGCLVLMRLSTTQVLGINAWVKPFKFFVSTLIFVWTMGWFMRYLTDSQASISAYSWGLIGLFTLEDSYIAVQAGRGQRSHFNIGTPFSVAMYSLMGLAAVAISVWTAYIGIRFFQQELAELPAAYRWGIRLGLVQFVLFSMEGMVMGSRLRHTVGGEDGGPGLPVVNWSRQHGDLRIAHFVGMHALQVIPLLSYYLLTSVWATVLVALLYGLIATWLFIRAMQGKPLLPAPRVLRHRPLVSLAESATD